MLIIPDKCVIPVNDHYYSVAAKRQTEEVYSSSYVWGDNLWTINKIEKCPLSTRITVERNVEEGVTVRTGLYCPESMIGKKAFNEIRDYLKICRKNNTRIRLLYPNSNYRSQNIFCGVRAIEEDFDKTKVKVYTLSDINRKRNTFLQY